MEEEETSLNSIQVPVGIVSLGTYLPQKRLTSREISEQSGLPLHVVEEKLGIKQITIPGPGDHTAQMGVWAAEKALQKAGISPAEIDLVIYVGEEHKEYPLWTAGIYLQKQLGAVNAWAFDMALRCGTTVAAMQVAKALMLAHDHIRTVLLAGGYRNGDFIDFRNPRTRFMYNLAAGGGALILQKGYNRNVLLETEVITDGCFAEDVIVPAGGTKQPLTPAALASGAYQFDVPDPEGMKNRLEQVSLQNFIKVIRKSLQKSGYTEEQLDYLAILHMKRSAHHYVLKELKLHDHQAIYLEEIGHVGQFDQIISLELALNEGRISDGALISMVSAGIGYAWAANTIRWGRWR